jgi:hypothetical protein
LAVKMTGDRAEARDALDRRRAGPDALRQAGSFTPSRPQAAILQLQRTAGNRAVNRLITGLERSDRPCVSPAPEPALQRCVACAGACRCDEDAEEVQQLRRASALLQRQADPGAEWMAVGASPQPSSGSVPAGGTQGGWTTDQAPVAEPAPRADLRDDVFKGIFGAPRRPDESFVQCVFRRFTELGVIGRLEALLASAGGILALVGMNLAAAAVIGVALGIGAGAMIAILRDCGLDPPPQAEGVGAGVAGASEQAVEETRQAEAARDDEFDLSMGAQGGRVAELQDLLNAAGADPPLDIDSIFGPATRQAVIDFQRAHGLVDDGTVSRSLFARIDAEGRARSLSRP